MIGVGDFKATEEMIEAIVRTLRDGRLSYGRYSQELERNMAELHGDKFGVLSNSGTSSLQVALQAMKEIHHWNDGDEVIVPASTFVATVNIVLHNRMKPVLVDIEPDMFAIQPEGIEEKLTNRTVAIIPVHPFGQPADMARIQKVAWHHGLKVIQDSCECVGVQHNGAPLANYGDIICFSTYIAHIITSGVGGLATTSDPKYAEIMRSLVNHGRDNIYISPSSTGRLEEVIGRRFKFDRIGHSFRITELEAILAVYMLKDLDCILSARNSNAEYLRNHLSHLSWLSVMSSRLDTGHSWMMFPIVVEDPTIKKPLVKYLEKHGIETRDALPLTNQPCYCGMFNEDDYPNARRLNRCGFYIGCHQYITTAQLDYIIDTIGGYSG